MDKINQDILIAITKKLSGEISSEENEALSKWRKDDPQNENVFRDMEESWLLVRKSSSWVIPDTETIWEKIRVKIEKPVLKTYSRSILIRVASIAAVVTFVLGLSIPFIFSQKNSEDLDAMPISIKLPKGQKSELILPDGTSVWLNSGSTLTYYTNYNKDNRNIKLEGEAFFDVAKNKDLKFNVFAGDIKVKVLGTAFNVNAYSDNENINVSLLRGEVSLYSNTKETLIRPNQKVIFDKKTLHCTLVNCDAENESIWRLGRLKIEGATIDEIIKKMERWYGVDIQLQGKKINELYWFTIKTESLTEMLELINKITPIQYSIKGEEVIIRYK